jgi:hypothetical protein
LRPAIDKKGYLKVILCQNNKRYNKKVHRLVALMFIPNPENKPEVNHKNGIKTDCRKVNLEWNTPKENRQHAFNTGLSAKGENHVNSKLTEAQVLSIRADTRTQQVIADEYCVTQAQISSIKTRKLWKHI